MSMPIIIELRSFVIWCVNYIDLHTLWKIACMLLSFVCVPSSRSWLVSEGLISSEGELTESPCGSEVFGSSPHSSISSSPCSEISQSSTLRPPNFSPSTRAKSIRLSSSSSSSPSFSSIPISPRNIPGSPSSSQPSCASSPQSEQPPSVTKPSSSPLQISSPPRKRLRVSSTSSTSSSRCSVVVLDSPPVMSKTPVYHPYHPEAWAPESPILLLLSRFSHASDPSTALVNTNVFSGLLYYLTQHHDPSGRCFRMLGRLSCNPNCFQALVRTGAVALIKQRLCVRGEEIGGCKGVTDRQSEKIKGKITQLGLWVY